MPAQPPERGLTTVPAGPCRLARWPPDQHCRRCWRRGRTPDQRRCHHWRRGQPTEGTRPFHHVGSWLGAVGSARWFPSLNRAMGLCGDALINDIWTRRVSFTPQLGYQEIEIWYGPVHIDFPSSKKQLSGLPSYLHCKHTTADTMKNAIVFITLLARRFILFNW